MLGEDEKKVKADIQNLNFSTLVHRDNNSESKKIIDH